jgi:dTDP-glucose 4,6-dehydratase
MHGMKKPSKKTPGSSRGAHERILITGGAGFIGHHIVEYILDETDWDIVILDRLDVSGTLNRLADLPNWAAKKTRVKFVFHDFRAPLNEYVKTRLGDVHYILHLAASTHVDRSIEDPMLFVEDNVVGTTNMLQYARTLRITFFTFSRWESPCWRRLPARKPRLPRAKSSYSKSATSSKP